jgi:hypothetical protein
MGGHFSLLRMQKCYLHGSIGSKMMIMTMAAAATVQQQQPYPNSYHFAWLQTGIVISCDNLSPK